MSANLTRREVLVAALGASMAALASTSGCRSRPTPDGELIDIGGAHAHAWLREGLSRGADSITAWNSAPKRTSSVVIVGAGVAGLSAAWRLVRAGLTDITILEVDDVPGGTARSGSSAVTPFPWGAHYVVAPDNNFKAFQLLLHELGAFEGNDAQGRPIVAETAACREPEERHFRAGRFHAGLYPLHGETTSERQERARFAHMLNQLTARSGSDGKRWFALPQATASRDPELLALDRQTFASWLSTNGFHSWRLRWLCNYACRDDYGCTLQTTSARAGLMYFCARRTSNAAADDVDGGRTVITWPDGNGRIVQHMLHATRANVLCKRAAVRVREESTGLVQVDSVGADGPLQLHAQHVVVAVPGFVAARILPVEQAQPGVPLSTSPWAVVNLHLSRRPSDRGQRFAEAMPWDTVFTESESVGYVAATHQSGRDHGPTVLTWYRPLTDSDPVRARKQLQALSREHWAEAALSELSLAHPDIREVVTRVDVARFGHAMVRPTPGLWADSALAQRATARGRIHVAHTDLSGMALCEEAFYAGVHAAEAILRSKGQLSEQLL